MLKHVFMEGEIIGIHDSEVLPLSDPGDTRVIERRSRDVITESRVGVGGGALMREHNREAFGGINP